MNERIMYTYISVNEYIAIATRGLIFIINFIVRRNLNVYIFYITVIFINFYPVLILTRFIIYKFSIYFKNNLIKNFIEGDSKFAESLIEKGLLSLSTLSKFKIILIY